MVAKAVMRAWQEGLGGPPPMGRIYSPKAKQLAEPPLVVEQPPSANDNNLAQTFDDRDDDPEIRTAKREDIVPRRPGAASGSMSDDSFWSSHLFWKGIVVGAVIVLLVKTAMAVHAPFEIEWYRF